MRMSFNFVYSVASKALSNASAAVSCILPPSIYPIPTSGCTDLAAIQNASDACANALPTTDSKELQACISNCTQPSCCNTDWVAARLKDAGINISEAAQQQVAELVQTGTWEECSGPTPPPSPSGDSSNWKQPDLLLYLALGALGFAVAAAAFRNMVKNGEPDVCNGGTFAAGIISSTAFFSAASYVATGSVLTVSGVGLGLALAAGVGGAAHMFYRSRNPLPAAAPLLPPAPPAPSLCLIQ